jgi:hypothetical protein
MEAAPVQCLIGKKRREPPGFGCFFLDSPGQNYFRLADLPENRGEVDRFMNLDALAEAKSTQERKRSEWAEKRASSEMKATQTIELTADFDLIEYARRNRFRIRNLHDGSPVPPARRSGKSTKTGCIGPVDRWDVIVGQRGYLATENGGLSVFQFFNSARGVSGAKSAIEALDGQVTQEGDSELAASLPMGALDEALKLIRVSKLHPGNPVLPRPGSG